MANRLASTKSLLETTVRNSGYFQAMREIAKLGLGYHSALRDEKDTGKRQPV